MMDSVLLLNIITVIKTDVLPCLCFHDDRVSEQVLVALQENNLQMEVLPTFETRSVCVCVLTVVCCDDITSSITGSAPCLVMMELCVLTD